MNLLKGGERKESNFYLRSHEPPFYPLNYYHIISVLLKGFEPILYGF